jgi:hypothetical protein
MPYVTEQNLTEVVLERWKAVPDPRLRQVMHSFIKHVHAFVRDIEPTEAEWAMAIDLLTLIGQKCDDKRQEFILFSDVMGVSMLIDALNHRLESRATPTTVEGPFHVPNAPAPADGGNMAAGCPGIRASSPHGQRPDGKPVVNARLDLWQTDGEGPTRPARRHRAVDCACSQPNDGHNPHGRADRLPILMDGPMRDLGQAD